MPSRQLRASRVPRGLAPLFVACVCPVSITARAQTPPADPARQRLEELIRQNQELQRQIEELRRDMDRRAPQPTPVAPPAKPAEAAQPPVAPQPTGQANPQD